MLTKKIVSLSLTMALTASVSMLAGCPAPTTNTPTESAAPSTAASSAAPTESVAPSAAATTAPSAAATTAPTAAPAVSGSPAASTAPTAAPTTQSSTAPIDTVGITPDVKEKATFNGKVVDPSSVPVDGAKVSAKAIDPGVTWASEEQLTAGGAFVFRNAPVGARILITVTKDGWTTRQRTEVLKSNLTGDPLANKFDFDGIYAIQDEPEVTSLKINTKGATATGPSTKPTVAGLETASANLSGLDNGNLEVEMTFSEPVRTDDVQNFFRVTAQNFSVKNNTNFTIDNNLAGINWTWSNNDQTVKFMTNQAVLANTTGNEARYMLEFTQAFRDKTDKEARTGKYIRFNPANTGDFNVFSVKNDETDPKLLSITATDGGSSNDVIELKFSEAMTLINRQSDELSLADPSAPSNRNRQLRVHQTNNGGTTNGNNATVLGYSKADAVSMTDFRGVFTIGRLVPTITGASKLMPLTISGSNAGTLISGLNSVTAKITGSNVKLEFPSTAFDRNDRIIASVGRTILGRYTDRNANPAIDFSLDVDIPGVANSVVGDPASKTMSTGNSTTSSNITVNDSQRVSTVN